LLIAVDVGNTNITVGTFAGEKLLSQFRLETDPRRSFDGYARALKKSWRHSPDQCTAIIYASVVPGLDRILRNALRKAFGRGVTVVTPHSSLGFKLKVRAPAQVGADRILNALALNYMFGGPAIAIDFGTATTFDCIDSNGDYIGGSILLGPMSAARALHEYTAKLPLVSVRKPRRAIGPWARWLDPRSRGL
jgi:type III pantothenate kinase